MASHLAWVISGIPGAAFEVRRSRLFGLTQECASAALVSSVFL
jgi:hypothetical protein